MTDIFEKVKDQVKIADAVEAFGIKLNSRDKGLCPFHREKTPSFSIDRKNNIFTCFGCGETGDVITFASKIKEVEPLEAAKLLAEMFHIDVDDCSKRTSIKDYLKACIRDADKTDYFQKRGLTKETVKKYCLGYDVKRNAIVLPYSSELRYYQTRSISDKKFYKPTNEEAGAEPLFNRKALWGTSKEPVFIVESPLCALSIMQCGGVSVSLCGVGGANKLVKEAKAKKPNAPLVLCLDNDEPGQKATETLEKELQTAKIPYISVTTVTPSQPSHTIEETVGALSVLYDAGYDGSTAGTSLRQAFVSLMNPSTAALGIFEELGIAVEDVNPATNDFASILDRLRDAGLDTAQAMEIFGARGGPGMLALMSAGGDAVRGMTKAITGTNKATDMAATQLDTLQGQWKILKSELEEIAISFGDVLIPLIRQFITKYISPLTAKIMGLSMGTRKQIVVIALLHQTHCKS